MWNVCESRRAPLFAEVSRLGVFFVFAALAVPARSLLADNWIADPATPAPFGVDANWSLGVVPLDPESAIINNGGTATIGEEDVFVVSRLEVGQTTTGNAVTQTGGSLTTSGPIMVGNGAGAGGTYSISGSSIIMTGGIGSSDNTSVGRAGGTGVMSLSDGATMLVSTGEFFVGQGGNSQGTLNMSGATELAVANWIAVGRQGGTGTVNLSGFARFHTTGGGFVVGASVGNAASSGTLNVTENAEAFYTGGNALFIGEGATGVVNVSGSGQFRSEGSGIWVGHANGGKGTLNISGDAAVSANNETYIGNEGAMGFVNMSGNATFSTPSQKFVISRFDGVGSVLVEDNAVLNIGGSEIVVAENAAGSLTIRGNGQVIAAGDNMNVYVGSAPFTDNGRTAANGTLTMQGGTLSVQNGEVVVALRANATGHIQMDGGVIKAHSVRKGDGAGTITFNGGGVQAQSSSGDYFTNFAAANISIQAGGLYFDTAGNNVTITQKLAGVGGLAKLGEGVLTLADGGAYTGDTVIAEGTLSINTGFLVDGSNVWLWEGGTFDLNFSDTDVINALFVDGVAMELGTWGATGSGAEHIDDTLFSGTGTLTVTSTVVPEPSVLALLLASGLVAGIALRRRG